MDRDINPNDVLLGRGGHTFRHIGNRKFRELARTLAKKYVNSTKLEKSKISRDMVNSLRDLDPPGRFLKKVSLHEWEEVANVIAREKASQCLRDAVSELVSNTENPDEDATTAKEIPEKSYLEADSSDKTEKPSSSVASPITIPAHIPSEKTEYNYFSLQRGHQMNQQMSSQEQVITQDRNTLFNYNMESSFAMRQSNDQTHYDGIFYTSKRDVYEPHSSNQHRQIFRDASPLRTNVGSQSIKPRHQFPEKTTHQSEKDPPRTPNQHHQIFRDPSPLKTNVRSQSIQPRHQFPKEIVYQNEKNLQHRKIFRDPSPLRKNVGSQSIKPRHQFPKKTVCRSEKDSPRTPNQHHQIFRDPSPLRTNVNSQSIKPGHQFLEKAAYRSKKDPPHTPNQHHQIFRDPSPLRTSVTSQSMKPAYQVPKEIAYQTEKDPHKKIDYTQAPCDSLDQQTCDSASAGIKPKNANLDRRSYGEFVDNTEDDAGKSSSLSCVSPSKKKSKKQILSFDDFDLLHCHSTSHSVDSIDSFAKSL